jgi:hypothetical protein
MWGENIKIPKNEILWVQYLVDGKPKYTITSDKLRSVYYLCEVVGEKLVKTKYKNKDPTELDKYVQTKSRFDKE